MPGAVFGAGTGAAYAALSSGPRDTPQRVLMTPTQRVFVPQLKSLPHSRQIPPAGARPPTVNLSRAGLSAREGALHTIAALLKTQACRDSLPGLAQLPAGLMCAKFLPGELGDFARRQSLPRDTAKHSHVQDAPVELSRCLLSSSELGDVMMEQRKSVQVGISYLTAISKCPGGFWATEDLLVSEPHPQRAAVGLV